MRNEKLGTIKILGPGCKRCQETEKLLVNALSELQLTADIQDVKDASEIARHGVLLTPAVIINDELVSQGKIPGYEEVKGWLRRRTVNGAGQH